MKISIQDSFYSRLISSLAWYHNGSKLSSDDRVSIANNGTTLTISHMNGSDAGKYEVKINSIEFKNGINLDFCDINILPMLENLALYSPVTFLLQESYTPEYNPEDIIVNYILSEHQGTQLSIDINNILMINTNAVLFFPLIDDALYKDGLQIGDMAIYNSTLSHGKFTNHSLKMTYNNTDDIAGQYVHLAYNENLNLDFGSCFHYLLFTRPYFPLFTFYWNIKPLSKLEYWNIVSIIFFCHWYIMY